MYKRLAVSNLDITISPRLSALCRFYGLPISQTRYQQNTQVSRRSCHHAGPLLVASCLTQWPLRSQYNVTIPYELRSGQSHREMRAAHWHGITHAFRTGFKWRTTTMIQGAYMFSNAARLWMYVPILAWQYTCYHVVVTFTRSSKRFQNVAAIIVEILL